ncbi:phosphoglycerate kinase [Porphyromonas levii]|uniref:phosphoglycerate kinase n=1 Tax=Porphyromonas levii TaxID=28114 RepID=UPI001B8B899B|nr:phosphoglycerate kinase [Porphyromonas levii]MBR8713823.1 Phosphoglycerate kinase [Porphyromonas levii]MBR8715663.1 Phosphoglycerate kinase [Porphyromonas levii]MBR8728152.1 Phosphoglycerate kinase [Porphyromonas levii]MBR8731554.1 Phosphoglycerate kinase [Porphyromonas levii]MBR8736688.1 Phosphoglycerate kinase [Porphyromonas levii]
MANIENFDFRGKRVFVRVDFNVPMDENKKITDDTRMRAALPTLQKIQKDGGRLIIGSHMGRPKGVDKQFSLDYIRPHLEELLGTPVKFADDCVSDEALQMANELKDGEVLLLENLRFHAEEEGKGNGKAGQPAFTERLANMADVYVNDAFGTAHRAHASTALIADHFDADHKMFGFLMGKEVAAVERVMDKVERPFTAIMGGSKVSSKIEIIENLMNKVDNLILTGGMVYTFMKARGGKIGNSICEDDKLDLALEIERKAKEKGVNLVLGVDSVIGDDFSNDANTQVADSNNIPDGWEGLDIGPKTQEKFAAVIRDSKTILWNGPFGVFEFDTFAKGSEAMAKVIAETTAKGAYSLVGGGDSVAAVNKFGLADQMSYVSTGGGALLEAIEGKVLPGIAAINRK